MQRSPRQTPLRRRATWAVLPLATTVWLGSLGAHAMEMVPIPGGRYTPLFGDTSTPIEVDAFWLDATPVTNEDFLAFVEGHPRWRRSRVPSLMADEGYLEHWAGDLELAEPGVEESRGAPRRAPVTHVSWFAARAYCRAHGKRLPNLDEWEFAALASEDERDASEDPVFRQRILDWYGVPAPDIPPEVGSVYVNVYGAHDLHGLVWEWVEDFLSLPVTGESRGDESIDRALYCAGASSGASDKSNYAAFLRHAMRASVDARYTSASFGFRCAKDTTDG